MSDQHRGDCMGCSGHPAVNTPNLDRLARDGVNFRFAYSSTPTCTPARAALLTGMSPWNHGMLGYGRVADRYPVETPRALRDAGYYTMGIGKMHWSPQRNLHGFHHALLDESGRTQSIDFRSDYRAWFWSEAPNLDPDATGVGFNDYTAKSYVLPERLHPTAWTGDCAVRFLESYQRAEPFFLKVSFARPHSPYDPPDRLMRRYQDAPIPKRVIGAWAKRYEERNSARPDIWRGDLGEQEARRSRQGYYGSVSFIDEQIGRILEALEKRGLLEETLVIYTSDHGDMTGDHHLWRKSYAYEPSARIPMLLRWPKGLIAAERGRTLANVVEIRDILATFLDAAGASPRAPIDGRSLLAAARGAEWREYIDLEHDTCYAPENHWSALTDGRRKYIYHARDAEEQLFDLERDPGETRSLASDPAHEAELRRWRNRLIEHLQVRGPKWVA
ncbi:MAG: arylsulfatase, partial [Acidobacteria bacterium]|nr:arylsulfatase [Acidobacteriota bacterium]